jgi:phosphotransferase system  glucose/maltose/N-acetylglucosamine-specific IIC component
MNTLVQTKPGIKTFLAGALIAGVIGAILNNVYGLLYTSLTGVSVPHIIHAGSITMASILPVLIGGLVYFALSRFTAKATLIFVIIGIVFTLISFISPLQPQLPDGTPAPEGFAGLTLPMHIISGVVALWILPRYVHKRKLL